MIIRMLMDIKDFGKSNSIATSISSFRNCGLGWFINISNIEKSEVVNALIENNTFAQDLENIIWNNFNYGYTFRHLIASLQPMHIY